MRSIGDLREVVSRPGTRLVVTGLTIAGVPATVPVEQAAPRTIHHVSHDAIVFEDGRFLPLGCVGTYHFDGSPDRFQVSLGPALVQYDIAQGIC